MTWTPTPLKRGHLQAGKTWEDGFVKFPYLIPSEAAYLIEVVRLIDADQIKIFQAVEATEGIDLERDKNDAAKYFSIIERGLLSISANRRGIYLDANYVDTLKTNSIEQILNLDIYCVMGGGKEKQYDRSTLVLRALGSFFIGMNYQELIRSWPRNIIDQYKSIYQPEIRLNTVIRNDPDNSKGAVAQRVGPIPSISLSYTIVPKANIDIPAEELI